jgi:hydrogenase expression/formation protein HypC
MCLGVPGRIVEVYDAGGLRMGRIDFGGVLREACLAYVPEADVGDYTVIHVGFAISVLSEDEALETLEMLSQIADLGAELGPGIEADEAVLGAAGTGAPSVGRAPGG